MSDLDNLEALRARKEQLLLEQEVARLERRQNISKAGGWSWWWVGPLTAFGVFLIFAGMDGGGAAAIFIGLLLLVPTAMKLFFKK